MTKEYRAKVFKSGNSVALRLPKALGLKAGEEMVVREERGKFEFEPVEEKADKIDLTGIYGAIPGLSRMVIEETERDWDDEASERG
jgi:antitoxin VapB